MDENYGSARNGSFTMVRYTDAHLSSQDVIDEINSRGFKIYAMDDPARVVRDIMEHELDYEIRTPDDLLTKLYPRDCGVPGGIAMLDDKGDIPNDNLPNPVVTSKGDWNPVLNDPMLLNGMGNSGDQYMVTNCPNQIDIDLGDGPITVVNDNFIMYRDGKYVVSFSDALSKSEKKHLENSMQNVDKPRIISPHSTIEIELGDHQFVQIMNTECPRGEYHLQDNGGLTNISLHPITGELYIRSSLDTVGKYTVTIAMGASLGQVINFEIYVDIIPVEV